MATWAVGIFLVLTAIAGPGSDAQDCGVAPLNTRTRIVGGSNATAGSWPWQVSLHYNPAGYHICGGTLINNQWILTAAHCIISNAVGAWTVFLGRETQSGPNVNEVRRNVSQIIVHPNYNDNSIFLNNDIALMKLSSSVNFTEYIRPICLASNSSQFHNSTSCWATGWGNLNKNNSLPSSYALQEVEVPVIGNKQCTCNYANIENVTITDKMICAGQENKGACQGDSGGPLQCKQGSVWIQAGITSFGVPCALANIPEVYARVSEFQTWITDNIVASNVSFVKFNSNGTDPDSSYVCTNSTENSATELKFSALLVTLLLYQIFGL